MLGTSLNFTSRFIKTLRFQLIMLIVQAGVLGELCFDESLCCLVVDGDLKLGRVA